MSTDQALRVVATEAASRGARAPEGGARPARAAPVGGLLRRQLPDVLPRGRAARPRERPLLGEVAGCPFYVDAEQYERWGSPSFVLDVGAGAGSGFSLEGLHDVHFRIDGSHVV